MAGLDAAYEIINRFRTASLRTRISHLEDDLRGTTRKTFQDYVQRNDIQKEQLIAALLLKRASSQVNEIVHALGILLALPYILEEEERIEYVSLAAGNTGRPFDLETSTRIAEFKFTDWKGGPEAIRQNQLFKDFYLLADYDTTKRKQLYFLGSTIPHKFFEGNRALSSVFSRSNKLWTIFQGQFGEQYATVSDYFREHKHKVELVNLESIIPYFTSSIVG